MKIVRIWLKKILKTILWMVFILAVIFAIITVIIQIPAIQNKIVHGITSYVSNKTHSKIEIKKVRISFPKSVIIEGLYLEDLKKDTLLYAGKVKINIVLSDLLNSKITIGSIAIEEVYVNLHSTKKDSLFNYNFLTRAFVNTTKQAITAPQTPSNWIFSINQVNLKNLKFRYDDACGGINVIAFLKNSEFNIDEIDPKKSIYSVIDLLADGLTANVLVINSQNTPNSSKGSMLPKISVKSLQLSNSLICYIDSSANQSVISSINRCKLEDASIDLEKQLLFSDYLSLSNSKIQYHAFSLEVYSKDKKEVPVSSSETNWKVILNQITSKDNSLLFETGNKPPSKNTFDPDHLEYNKLTLSANGLLYSSDSIKISVTKFSAIDQNNFAIINCEANFRMDQHSISIRRLKAQTSCSTIDADLELRYYSFASVLDSLQFNDLKLDLRNLSLKNSDLLYFKPNLNLQPFFKASQNVTTVSGIIRGQMNDLSAKNLVIKTGINTKVETDFIIKGLPKIKSSSFNFPNLSILSGKKDIVMMAGSYIPDIIDIPEKINMKVVFKGKMKSFESTVNMTSNFGNANLVAAVDAAENFNCKVRMNSFDVGRFLKDTILYGPVSLTAEATGQGLDLNTIKAKIKGEAMQIHLNNYTYHNLKLDGTVTGKEFEGKINLNDENAVFDFDGLVNLNPNKKRYKFNLVLKGADLQKLKITKKDARIAFVAAADFKGETREKMNGIAEITNFVVASQGKTYVLNSFFSAIVNEPNKSENDLSSSLIGLKYNGTVSPDKIPGALSQFLNKYFPVTDSTLKFRNNESANFNFEIRLHNHPILSEVLLPQLKEFEPGIILGSFDNQKNELKLNAKINKIVYGTTEISDFTVEVKSDETALKYKISSSSISNAQVKLDNFSLEGELASNKIFANISSTNGKNKKLLIRSQITREKMNYKIKFDPKELYVLNNRWDISNDHFIEFGKKGFLIHHFFINHAENQINIASVHDQFNDDLNIEIKNFRIDDISRIIEKDSSLVKGIVDGNILLKRVNNSYGLVADAKISNLFVLEAPIGNLTVKAENSSYEKFNVNVNLSGAENNLTANGYFIPNGGDNSIRINTSIQSLSLKAVQAFSLGQLKESSGTLSGNILFEGKASAPDITGEIVFSNAIIKPTFLNNRLELKHETIQLKKDGIYFNSFKMQDAFQHSAIIDGSVQMKQLSDYIFNLQVNAKDFLLFNTTVKDNKEFFGRMIIDSRLNIIGPIKSLIMDAKVKIKKGSNFTFSVPEDKLTTDKGENVVEFDNTLKFNPILYRGEKKGGQTSGMTGFDLSSIIEIDKQATLRLLMDPSSTDSLVVKGDAALSFAMDRSGKMSLTGAYNLIEGSYLVSLESVIKKKFDIDAGSTIIWNGDPLDAEISINARYSVRASPYDLVADQLSGLSDIDKGGYKQRYPFLVILKLRRQILLPEISFSIQLPAEDKGILGGAVNQKLSMLNEDESALNKQVFALLVLGRFVQENPFQTESTGTSTIIRSTVGKFLSAQLNQLSSKILPGIELNFDIQSYDDYQSGLAKGRTQVEIGVKKQLFNERLSVQLGGAVDVEGERVKQNSASDITSDVTVEYKLTGEGSFRLKGFRHNQYEGAIEGQLVETGIGLVFVRDFNRWNRIFMSQKSNSDSSKTQKNNVTVSPN